MLKNLEMKQFDYNNYTKNNPLLKETTIEEAKPTVRKMAMTGPPLDGGKDSDGNPYKPYKVEVDFDTFRIIQGKNVIEISRKASKQLAKEIRDSFF
jgi:hypothetical protein